MFSLFVHHHSPKGRLKQEQSEPKGFSHPQIWKESLDFYMYEILSDSEKMYHRLPCAINRDFWSKFLSKPVRPRKSK
jgi:hypothetical protein